MQHDAKKRGFDNTPKNSVQTQKGKKNDQGNGQPRPAIVPKVVLDALAQPATILEHVKTLKELILAGPDHCNVVCNKICSDVMDAMKMNSTFSTCKLYAFGSMTTGLAFKDSDLDVYAHLGLFFTLCFTH